jgi:hypothetical protein
MASKPATTPGMSKMTEEVELVTATKGVGGAVDSATSTAAGDSVALTTMGGSVVGTGSTSTVTAAGDPVTPTSTGDSVTATAVGDSVAPTVSRDPVSVFGAATGGGVEPSTITDTRTLHTYALTAGSSTVERSGRGLPPRSNLCKPLNS